MSPASAKETHVGVGGSDLSLDQGPSWRQESGLKSIREARDLGEQGLWNSDFGNLKRDVAIMAYDLGALGRLA